MEGLNQQLSAAVDRLVVANAEQSNANAALLEIVTAHRAELGQAGESKDFSFVLGSRVIRCFDIGTDDASIGLDDDIVVIPQV
jgi:NCAIR mutase (PurE)-related protein